MKEIPLSLPCLGEAEVQAVGEVLRSGWVTQGPRVRRFEHQFAQYVGSRHACAVSSCTTALHLALLAVGVRPGEVVLTVSHSFIATANAIRHCQAEPFFVDIDPDTLNLSPAALARSLEEDFETRPDGLFCRHLERLRTPASPLQALRAPTGRLAALLVVHQVGMPADLGTLLPLARRFDLPLIEDAACAIGSEISLDGGRTWERIGRPHGDISCFSFHPRKVITTGDGGMIATNNANHDHFCQLMRQHGMSISDVTRHASHQVLFEAYEQTGYNFRLTDLQAAVGCEQLKRLPEIVRRRRALATCYATALRDVRGLRPPSEPPYARTNWQSYVIHLGKGSWQRPVMQALLDRGISTRRGVMCAHREPPYAAAWPAGSLPVSERARDTGLLLPLFPDMDEADVPPVANELQAALDAVAGDEENG
jgi:dTDP-4-amino-4,6-dideoxygalactose transaminase